MSNLAADPQASLDHGRSTEGGGASSYDGHAPYSKDGIHTQALPGDDFDVYGDEKGADSE